MAGESGWISYTSGDNAHLSEEQRRLVEQRIAARRSQQGRLLATVQVAVYEHGEEPQVSFPHDAMLSPESDSSEISEVVRRARTKLDSWR